MDINSKTAVKIKETRENKNIKQADFAKSVGLGTSAYSRIENGETQITLKVLYKIAEVLELPVGVLLNIKSTSINNFNAQLVAQTGGTSNVNITLTPEQIEKVFAKVNGEGAKK
jgi:transcriptional regulator with XRE-family HTH domain